MEIIATPIGKKNVYELRRTSDGNKCINKTELFVQYTDEELIVNFSGTYNGTPDIPYSGEIQLTWKGEVVEAFLSPYGSEQEYFEFDVAPNASSFCAKILNPDGVSGYARMYPDTPIKIESYQKAEGFEVQIRVPFDVVLKEEDKKSFKTFPWKCNFYRVDSFNKEYCALSPTGIINFHIPKYFINLKFE
jgi:hypothetical protein